MKRILVLHSLVLASSLAGSALAGNRAPAPTVTLPAYQQECTACHIAYPPSLLAAQSWQRIMAGLPHHFGTDASLDAAQVRQIGAWLAQEASPVRPAPPEDRITRSTWFVREHRKLPAAVWERPSVKGPSNCAACHTLANQGDFNEHSVRIPR